MTSACRRPLDPADLRTWRPAAAGSSRRHRPPRARRRRCPSAPRTNDEPGAVRREPRTRVERRSQPTMVRGAAPMANRRATMSPFDRVERSGRCAAGPNGAGRPWAWTGDEHGPDARARTRRASDADGPPRDPRRRRRARGDRGHGDPPFGDPPGRATPRASGPREDLAEQRLGLAHRRVCRQPGGQEAVEIVARGHADRLSFRIGARVSASSAARIAWVARWRRERTVPGGMPSASAASSRERPR